jgi:hypothetical protein
MKNTTMLTKLNQALDTLIDKISDNPIVMIIGALIGPFIFVVAVLAIIAGINYCTGTDGFGPERDEQITVQRLYVDKSSYMVGTDKGVYEVQNFILPIQIFNSDELYSKLEVGKTYSVTLKGNKVLNPIMQQYPYIISIK